MSLPLFLHGIGSVGVFASRAFLPAFMTALLIRFGPQIPGLAGAGLLSQVRDVPTWFTSDAALISLGVLSALELAAERFPDAKVVLDEFHDYLKSGMAVLTYLGVLNATDRAAAGQLLRQAGLAENLPAIAVGAGVYLASRARGAIFSPLAEADEDDDLGLQGLLRWAGDLWAGLGPLALVVFPILTVAAFGLAVVALVAIERRVEHLGEGEGEGFACVSCGRGLHACALACPSCNAAVVGTRDVGLLGRAKTRPADLTSHAYRLVAVKRCPVCATKFDRRAVKQPCRECGHRLMEDPRFAASYLGFIDRRVPTACAVCLLLGLVPIIGLIPGVIFYRLAVVAPFRRYIPTGQGFLLRWGVRSAVLVLVAFQWIPVAGGLAVPSMALITYAAYRSTYRKHALATGRPDDF